MAIPAPDASCELLAVDPDVAEPLTVVALCKACQELVYVSL